MPEMDGYEATRQIRALNVPEAKTIRIIAMTANVFREDIERCLEAGMDNHVGKPLDFEDVIGKLHQYLPKKYGSGRFLHALAWGSPPCEIFTNLVFFSKIG
jgi:CheY-like chemotaxis protein